MKKNNYRSEFINSLSDNYTKDILCKDIIAGIIVGIIAIPLSIALAISSGASPEVGLITAIVAGAASALLGGSRTQISGPTGAFVVIVYGIIAKFGFGGMLLATLMAGIIIILMGLLRLGKFIKHIPFPVIIGFTAGIATLIFIGQINDLLGLNLANMPHESYKKFIYIIKHLNNTDFFTLGLGILAIAIIIFLPKLIKKVPPAIISIIICALINFFSPYKATTLGDIFGTVSVRFNVSIGFIDFTAMVALLVPAITIAFLAALESLLSAVVADGMAKTSHNPNMELIGQGISNVVCSLFGGIPATGAIARTSANINSGGRTPVASLIHSVTVLVFALFLMPYAVYIPMTVFAAILCVICYNMFNVKEIKKVLKTSPFNIITMILTFALTFLYDMIIAIIACTLLYHAYNAIFKRKANNIIVPISIKEEIDKAA